MANNDKFQLYKSVFDLTVYIEECFRNFKRADKYTIGLELRKMVNDLLFKISTFNDLKREEKAAFCENLGSSKQSVEENQSLETSNP
ncbi:hypothetical protein II898_08590 [bacterium]|nr:hypothetical protein [bacterium]